MTFRQYLILMTAGTVLGTVAWIFTLLFVDPRTTGLLGTGIFLVTLLFMVTGFATIGGLFVRTMILRRHDVVARSVANSFRQGMLLALFVDGVLVLKSRSALTPWTTLFFIVLLTTLEFFMTAFRRR